MTTDDIRSEENPYRAARLRKGLSQEDLSTACGVDARTIRKLEQGQTVSRGTHRKVASALGIDPALDDDREVEAEPMPPLSTADAPDAAPDVDAPLSIPKTPWTRRPPFGLGIMEWGMCAVLVALVVAMAVGMLATARDISGLRASRVIARVSYEDDRRLLGLVDDLRWNAQRVGYYADVAERVWVTGSSMRNGTAVEIVLTPLWCPGDVCTDAIRRSVFDAFARLAREEGDALDVELATALGPS